MALNLALIKDHPYATGGVVIVGGLVMFYLLSSSQSSSAAAAQATPAAPGTSDADYQAALQANSQLAQVQASAQVQNTAAQVQLQQSQIAADVANQQTAASIATNNTNTAATLAATLAQISASVQENQANVSAQTADTANQYVYAENIQEMQDQVLTSQINSGVLENANNNATALAGAEATLSYQQQIAAMQASLVSQGITSSTSLAAQQESDTTDLAQQQETNFESNVQSILPNVGKAYNSALDANNALALQQTILTGGNPAVAVAGLGSSSTAVVSGNQSGVATLNAVLNSITNLGGKVANGLLAA
jgi:hypothetical protein